MSDFLFGAVYIIEQDYTDAEMARDLANMKACGYNLITLWPVANPWLARSSHEWIFERTRQVLDKCDELGMKAVLQLFGQNQAQEFMPDAALTPDMQIVDERGPFFNEDCFWANLNHPTVRAYMDTYFCEAIGALKEHPAVYGWDVFNEAHFRSDDPYTVRLYQQWLERKYGDIRKLNRDWYRRYESFSQVRPDKRRAPYSIWSSLLPDVEYEKFRSENLTEICRFLYETARKYDDAHPILIDGTSSQILAGDVTLRNNDEFETAYIPDAYGATFYPKSWGRDYRNTPWTLSMYFSIPAGAARKAGKPYFVNELQTHTQSVLTPGSEVSPEELRDWIFMCLFTAPAGMQLWRWRPFLHGYQSTGRGLTRMDGTPNRRSGSTAELLSVIGRNRELFADFTVAKPAVRIAYSYAGRLFFDSLLKWQGSFWAQNTEGWYKLFWNGGIPAEFTNLEQLDETDFKTPVLVVPAAVRINQDEAVRLTEYVEQGGFLIADGRMGAIDDQGVVPKEGIPGETLSRLFGVREVDVASGEAWTLAGRRIPAAYMSQQLEAAPDAEVLACMEDGTPAVVLHRVGKGAALYFNSFTGLSLLEETFPEVEQLILDAIAGSVGDLNVIRARKHEQVHLSFIESAAQQAMLAINFSGEEQLVRLSGLPAGSVMTELIGGTCLSAKDEGTAELALPAGACAVFAWEKSE